MKKVKHQRSITLKEKKTALPNALTSAEKLVLQRHIKEFTLKLNKDIEQKYPDDYKQTIMMDEKLTQSKNQILRKIKFHKAKALHLPNEIRTKREELLSLREQEKSEQATKTER